MHNNYPKNKINKYINCVLQLFFLYLLLPLKLKFFLPFQLLDHGKDRENLHPHVAGKS